MHPVLFVIGSRPIFAYGVMLGLSLILGWQIVMALGKRDGLSKSLIGDVYLTTAIAGLVGARLLYVATNTDEFTSPVQWLDITSGGLVAYGGFLGGFLGAFVHLKRAHMPLLAFADTAAPALGLGLFFTRVGCYLYGCDFGARLPASAPTWLARMGTFPRWHDMPNGMRGSPAFLHHVDIYGLARDAQASYPVHPTQLYEAALGLVLVGVCARVWQHRKFQGQVLLVFTLGYAVSRFLLEYLRDDPERGEALGFSTSQLISLLLVPTAAIAYSVLARRAREASAARPAG
ncbi:MAG TPA: prolipoprotein diacylglyceryl transferase family protein [Polyangiales bacterium]